MAGSQLAFPAEIADYWTERRGRIDDALARKLPGPGTPPAVLHRALRHSLLAPGKRIRGVLLLATADMFRGVGGVALELACAVEMVHAASLVLDDLPSMGDATVRRGREALHRLVGEAVAVLAAAALLNRAYEVVGAADGLRDGVRGSVVACLAAAIGERGMIGGQTADLGDPGSAQSPESLEPVYRQRSGALFVAATEIGALAGGGGRRERERLRRFAGDLGLAFQIADDLLEYSRGPEVTGKDAGLDRDRTTFIDLLGIGGARRLVDESIDRAILALDGFGKRAKRHRALAEFVRSSDR